MNEIRIIEESNDTPVTLESTKKYLRINSNNDDALITQFIAVARQYAERYTRQSLIGKTMETVYYDGIGGTITLPYPPIKNVTHIKCADNNGKEEIVPATQYRWEQGSSQIRILTALSAPTVTIRYTTGYDEIPPDIQTGLLHHIAKLYTDRGNPKNEIPKTVIELYKQHRIMRIW